MSDISQGPGWWRAADLKWYPPELHADYEAPLPPPPKLPPPPPLAADAAQHQPVDSTMGATPTSQQPEKPAKTRQVIERDRLGPLSKIGQGGQGVVYRAPNVKTKFAASMVYKEYKAQAVVEIDFTVLAAMPALVEESLTYAQAERLISIAAWPCAIIEDAGTPTGFVMPAIPDEFLIPLTTAKGVAPSTAEFQHLLNHPTVLAARGITLDDAQRYTLLRETASALAFLHKHGVCVGDISPKNLLFSLTPHEAVYFIDCDGMRINTVSALPQVETPGWNAPPGEELATIYTDTYKLGLLALRLLTGDQDTTNPGHLPATTPAQLRQIITDTLTNPPHQRPLPEAWTSVLANAIEHSQHQQKTTPPDSAAPGPPPTPIVRSRPPTHSAPPVRPSAPPPPPPRPAERPPTETGRPLPPPGGQRPRRQPEWAGVAALVVVIAAAGIVLSVITSQQHKNSNGPQHREPTYGPQVTLPFTGLNGPGGVAVDAAGTLYVTDNHNNRVLKLAAGSSTQDVLPFTGLNGPIDVAVDSSGDLYVADDGNNRVLRMAAGSSSPTVLPFTGLQPFAVAVDSADTLYVADARNLRVVKLAAGSSNPADLPFTGLVDGVAVNSAGDVYVTEGNSHRVVKLAAGSSTQTVLPFTGLDYVNGVAVNSAGDLYVVDVFNNRVLKLAAGSSTQTVLPFTGLNSPSGVAVNSAGDVYVTDNNNRVVKLPAG